MNTLAMYMKLKINASTDLPAFGFEDCAECDGAGHYERECHDEDSADFTVTYTCDGCEGAGRIQVETFENDKPANEGSRT